MGRSEMRKAIEDLVSIEAPFDEAKYAGYYGLLKRYLDQASDYKRSIGQPTGTPFVDVTRDLFQGDIPEPERSEFEDWLDEQTRRRRWSPTVGKVCRWYLKCKLAYGTLGPDQQAILGLYDPLIEILKLGGDFHDHHGAAGVGDRGMIWYEPPGGKR